MDIGGILYLNNQTPRPTNWACTENVGIWLHWSDSYMALVTQTRGWPGGGHSLIQHLCAGPHLASLSQIPSSRGPGEKSRLTSACLKDEEGEVQEKGYKN